jgi:RNA polymerase sigma-70 factor, ECF subfamily
MGTPAPAAGPPSDGDDPLTDDAFAADDALSADALSRAQAGDEAAFRRLWRQLQPRLLRFLRVYGCAEPDDVASETWLQAIRDLHRFDGTPDEFRAWLFSIARHRAIDATRIRTRLLDRLARVHAQAWAEGQQADPGGNPVETEVLEGLSTRQAVALVAGLSPDQREAVALRVIAGLDTPAVAGILRKSPGAVRVALHRGLKTLAADPRLKTLAEVDR